MRLHCRGKKDGYPWDGEVCPQSGGDGILKCRLFQGQRPGMKWGVTRRGGGGGGR